MCPHCRAFITTDDRVCPYCDARLERKKVERAVSGPILGGMIPQAHFTTVMILTINVGLYLVMVVYSLRSGNENAWMDLDGRTLLQFGAKLREAIAVGQWWRLITAGFLHVNLLHILMNSWVLFDLGAQVEELYGTSRFIVIYFVTTIAGFYASALFLPGLSAGASAGLFGLIGAMIALGVRDRYGAGGMLRGLYIRWAIYAMIIGFLLGADNAAHIGGGIAGFVLGYAAGTPNAYGGWGEKAWRIAAGVSIAVTAWAFVQMFIWLTGSRL